MVVRCCRLSGLLVQPLLATPSMPSGGGVHSIGIGSYELPWVLTYVAAAYRKRFGAFSDNEVFVARQWILDVKNPRRNQLARYPYGPANGAGRLPRFASVIPAPVGRVGRD